MPRPILFVVGQSATVAYLAPLWRRWLERGTSVSWRVLASPAAAKRIAYEQFQGLPWSAVESESAVEVQRTLMGWRPECLVMSASFAAVERAALVFAAQQGIPVARIIDTWYGYRRRLQWQGDDMRFPDRLLVIDEPARSQAIAEGIPEAIIEVIGQPAWESVKQLPPGDRRDILFVNQPIERYYGESLGYTERTVWKLFYETIQSNPQIARRVFYAAHPDDDMLPPEVPQVEVVESGLHTLPKVGAVVGMFSSLVTDALLSGRHVISFQPGALGGNMCALGRISLVPRALNAKELATALQMPTPDVGELRAALSRSTDRLERFCLGFVQV